MLTKLKSSNITLLNNLIYNDMIYGKFNVIIMLSDLYVPKDQNCLAYQSIDLETVEFYFKKASCALHYESSFY